MKFIRLFWKPPEPLPPVTDPGNYIDYLYQLREYPISKSKCLEEQAQKHSDWMFQNARMNHNGFNVRMNACNMWGGENVAWGQTSLEEVMRAWMNSSGHKRNIMNRSYSVAGYAVTGVYHCLLLGYPIQSGEAETSNVRRVLVTENYISCTYWQVME